MVCIGQITEFAFSGRMGDICLKGSQCSHSQQPPSAVRRRKNFEKIHFFPIQSGITVYVSIISYEKCHLVEPNVTTTKKVSANSFEIYKEKFFKIHRKYLLSFFSSSIFWPENNFLSYFKVRG